MPRDTETGRFHAQKHLGTEKQCQSTTKSTGERCTRHVVTVSAGGDTVYGTVCFGHGGKRQKKRLVRELQERKLEKVARKIGVPIEMDPAEGLLQQVWEAAGNVAWLREKVRELQTPRELDPRLNYPDLFEPEPSRSDRSNSDNDSSHGSEDHGEASYEEELPSGPILPSVYGPDHLGDLSPHVLIRMYNEERDRFVRYAKTAIECGLQERQVKLAEEQSRMVVNIIVNVLNDPQLALTSDQRTRGRTIAAQALRSINGTVEEGVQQLG